MITTNTEYYLLVTPEKLLQLRCQLSPHDSIMPQIHDAIKLAYPDGPPIKGWPNPEN